MEVIVETEDHEQDEKMLDKFAKMMLSVAVTFIVGSLTDAAYNKFVIQRRNNHKSETD